MKNESGRGARLVHASLSVLVLAAAAAALAQVATAATASRAKVRPPKISPHANVTAEATGANGAIVTYRPAKVRGAKRVAYSKRSGTLFPLGTTIVRITARNAAGTARSSFQVRVVDTTAPSLSAIADVTAEATGAAGATVAYTGPTGKDIVDGDVPATCAPAPNTVFRLGTTAVTCASSDRAGNRATTTFNVKVADTTAPTIAQHANVTAPATSTAGAAVIYGPPAATDAVDGTTTVTCQPANGSAFPIGTTNVTCSSRDAAGNTSTTSFSVTVTPLPATPGAYVGTTSQGAPIGFTVSPDGRRIIDFAIGIERPCTPNGVLIGALTSSYIADIRDDATFSEDGSYTIGGGGATGTATYTFDGRFTSSTAANGTFRTRATLTTPAGYVCDSDRITWSVSRTSMRVGGDRSSGEGAYERFLGE